MKGMVKGEIDELSVRICPSPGVLVAPGKVSFTSERARSIQSSTKGYDDGAEIGMAGFLKSEVQRVVSCGMHGPRCLDASCHHFLKYHDPKSEFYLGEHCVNCCFGDVQRENMWTDPGTSPESKVRAAERLG